MLGDRTRIPQPGQYNAVQKGVCRQRSYVTSAVSATSAVAFPIVLLLTLMLGSTPTAAQNASLVLRLNNLTHAIVDLEVPDAESIPLQSLFPYLETVEYLESKSGRDSVSWDAKSLNLTGWDDVLLVFRNQTPELHVGADRFLDPQRISVHGVRKPIDSIQIWSSIQIPQYKSNLLAALTLRDVEVKWKDVGKLTNRLENPPPEGMPHLVIADQLDMLRLGLLLDSPSPIMAISSQWYSVPSNDSKKRIAIDAYNPESALLYLLADDPNLFDRRNRLPVSLTAFLNQVSVSNGLVVSALPIASLMNPADDRITGAVRLPSSQEGEINEGFMTAEPPDDATNIIRYIYAAVPTDISSEQEEVARLVLGDAILLADLAAPENAVTIPQNPRIIRFFDAYTRIGRLAISNQISAIRASELISIYVADD